MFSNIVKTTSVLITPKNIISSILKINNPTIFNNNNNNYHNSNNNSLIMSSRISRRITSSLYNDNNNNNSNINNSDNDIDINNSSSEEDEKINKKIIVKKTKSVNSNSNKSSTNKNKSKKTNNNNNNKDKDNSGNEEIDKLTGKPIPIYEDGKKRCPWVPKNNKVYINYHDNEWGKVEKDSLKLFEKICLESQQAGLSWITVLVKRDEYRKCFYNFDPYQIKAKIGEKELDELMKNENLIRNRAKLSAIVSNAHAYCKMVDAGEDFSKFIWSFVNHTTKIGEYQLKGIPLTKDESSEELSKSLKKKGFKFVGPVCLYSFQQSMGLINDHHKICEFNPLNNSLSK